MNKEHLIEEINKAFDYKEVLKEAVKNHHKIIILGNGGSNAVASHISQDYTKALGKKAFTFSDPSRLTCYINDYGMENANTKFLQEFCSKNTLVIIMSSGGDSENMVRAVNYCKDNNIATAVLTGFNRQSKLADITFPTRLFHYWCDSKDYGVVECVHQILLHSIIGD